MISLCSAVQEELQAQLGVQSAALKRMAERCGQQESLIREQQKIIDQQRAALDSSHAAQASSAAGSTLSSADAAILQVRTACCRHCMWSY